MSKALSFILGLIVGIVVIVPLGVYLFARFGGIAMATTAKPLPMEHTIARAALRASLGDAAKAQNPLPATRPISRPARIYTSRTAPFVTDCQDNRKPGLQPDSSPRLPSCLRRTKW